MDMLQTIFLNNTIEHWLIGLGWAIGGIIAAKVLYKVAGKMLRHLTSKTKTNLDDLIVDKVEEPLVMAIALLAIWKGYSVLTFGEGADELVRSAINVAYALNITWGIARLLDAIILNFFMPFTLKKESVMMDQFAPILRKGLRSGVWVMGIIMAMNNAGFDVGALLAGVGIGGLALAMAAKDFVSNIFGGVTVFIDKPFKVGDRIQIAGYDGMVEEVGIRSTRIRTLAGRLVVVPNFKFSDSILENVTIEPARKNTVQLGLTYDTSPEQIQQAIEILRQIIAESSMLEPKSVVWFDSFGDFSLNVKLIYYVNKTGHWADTPGAVNLEILKRFNAAGLDFAFPTQTILTPDIAK